MCIRDRSTTIYTENTIIAITDGIEYFTNSFPIFSFPNDKAIVLTSFPKK